MKKFIAILVFAISFSAMAQQHNNRKGRFINPKFDAQQEATIKSKKMALHLDLTQQEQKKIYSLILKQEQKFRKIHKANKDNNTPLTQNQKFNRINKSLDAKIAFQSELKDILNTNQYVAWKKYNSKRIRQNAPRDRVGRK